MSQPSLKDIKDVVSVYTLLTNEQMFVVANQSDTTGTQEEVTSIISIGNLKKEDNILDLCCGQGRHTLELAQRGYSHVIGLDISPPFVVEAVTKQLELPSSSSAQLHIGNGVCMDHFKDNTFDKILLLGNCLAYVIKEDRIPFLKETGRVLKKDGQLILDYFNFDRLQKNFHSKTWNKIDAKQYALHEREISVNTRSIISRSILVTKDKGFTLECLYSEQIFSFAELSQLLQEAGFTDIHTHEGTELKHYITAKTKPDFIHDTSQFYPIEVRSAVGKGRGIFATRDIKIGDVVQRFTGPVMPYEKVPLEEQTYVCWTNGLYTDPVTPSRFINHSCEPNCVTNSLREIVAKKPIKAGEELSFCYNLSDTWDFWDPKWDFECLCGSEKCQKNIDCYVDKFGNKLFEPK